MHETVPVGLDVLDHHEMGAILGGMEAVMPSKESSWIYDICWCVGWGVHAIVNVLNTAPSSSYVYAKVGYNI